MTSDFKMSMWGARMINRTKKQVYTSSEITFDQRVNTLTSTHVKQVNGHVQIHSCVAHSCNKSYEDQFDHNTVDRRVTRTHAAKDITCKMRGFGSEWNPIDGNESSDGGNHEEFDLLASDGG